MTLTGFDADARTKALGSVPVVVGERTFFRQCRNHELMRQVRDLEDAEARARFMHNDGEALEARYKIAAVLLRDADGNPPDIDLLKENPEIAAAIASEAHTAIRRLQTAAADAIRQQRARMAASQRQALRRLNCELHATRAAALRRPSPSCSSRHRRAARPRRRTGARRAASGSAGGRSSGAAGPGDGAGARRHDHDVERSRRGVLA